MSAAVELALALVEARHLDALADGRTSLGWEDAEALAGRPVSRLHFGTEFCETLLPTPAQLHAAVAMAARHCLPLALVTPLMSDSGLERIRRLLPLLAPEAEVIANDWGVLRLLQAEFPALIPVAGRLLCKMVKDPRLPSAQWARLYPHGIHSAPFAAILGRLGVGRVEMDVAPFAEAADFRSERMAVSIHAGQGFAVKGRSCVVGSLHQPAAAKFATGHDCRRECLVYVGRPTRPEGGDGDLATIQRGNTLFYGHSEAMRNAVDAAIAAGWADRLVVAGDWR